MKKSIITQKIIAKAFKDLMQSNAYHQISVSDIMQTAKIRRQTFYNYFQNQEELLSWIFENDFAELINDNLDYYGWQNELLLLLRYLDENQIFYQKIFVIDKNFEHFFLIQWENLLDKVIFDQEKKSDYHWSDLEKSFICRYNAAAICAIAKESIIRGNSLEKLYSQIVKLLLAQIKSFES
ncbi:dihydroxyacetone kinase transcriptional activator DhaS [Lactococcus lactis]|uniref:Dihydroxyacetone kinase transcriptional activator DhaS n=1 Tax=Lactococcus lactis TaxID=1358 RepID=A0AAP8E3W8_9LACT|nr:dihydroxyacetone kinase transcriptional activator DhaS [Lactococcus lactis]MDG4970966.1 dihydroxyacetone kinase transcriptional activator DhaS [Lactococcus lactis]PFG90235.1 dihydroxyacetone kinase transcriptional activator DhaS [Lactococcus lactis]